ncbi:MAG: hypothetical protein HY075_03375 [Deltaproteobacteria bacterium]|nr:hypothetical protein [Deltaproteobacteria bacterium]
MKASRKQLPIAILCLFAGLVAADAGAEAPDTSSLPAALVASTTGGAAAPNDFTARDFTVEWKGAAPAGVTATLADDSLEWMRVRDVLALPRARLVLAVKGATAGLVTYSGFTTPLDLHGGNGQTELTVALVSGERNPIEISLDNGARKGALVVRFKPRATSSPWRVFFDLSCTRYGVAAENIPWVQPDQWAYVGCRLLHVKGASGKTTGLELLVFWDNAGQTLSVNGGEVTSAAGSLWELRLTPAANRVALKAGPQSLALRYAIPAVDRPGTLAIGFGPYSYTFEAEHINTHTYAAIITAYLSYRLSDTVRLVGFDASAAHYNYYNDTGIYLSTLSTKAFDNRLLVNIMLGAHALIFRSDGIHYFRAGGPQGFELTYLNAFKRNFNFSSGAFIYPPIAGKSYYNAWARWGSPKFFAELNFIAWREKGGTYDDRVVYNRSLGVSVGFPFYSF